MKKTLAAGSAVALGFVGAAVPFASLPAHAAVAPMCDTNGSMISNPADMDNWYQSCVPQFGSGKTEFTISSDVDFPADFKDLSDPSVTVETTTDLNNLYLYFGGVTWFTSEPTSPFYNLMRIDDGSDPKVQRYSADSYPDSPNVTAYSYFTVDTASKVTSAELPTECLDYGTSSDYGDIYKATFKPIDVTFSQTVNGENWSFHVVITPQPMYIAGTLEFNGSADQWSNSTPMCVVQGTFVSGGPANGNTGYSSAQAAASMLNPYSSNTWDGDSYYVGDYPRSVTALPATGLELVAPMGVAGGLLLAGLSVLAIRRRRA